MTDKIFSRAALTALSIMGLTCSTLCTRAQELQPRMSYDPYFIVTTDTVSEKGPRCITRNITQDRHGNMWLAAWSGIVRYDGKKYINETLKNDLIRFHVFAVLEDSRGDVWIGTIRGGAYRFDGKKYHYYSRPVGVGYSPNQGLADDLIVQFFEDRDKNIWVATDGGISKWDGKKFENYSTKDGLCGNSVNCITQDKDGLLWIATRTGVSTFDGKTFRTMYVSPGKPFDNARHVLQDKAGNMWIGGNDGLIRYRDAKMELMRTAFVGYIYEDSASNLWISEANGGGVTGGVFSPSGGMALTRFDGSKFEIIKVHNAPGDMQVFGIYEDKTHKMWYGTMQGARVL